MVCGRPMAVCTPQGIPTRAAVRTTKPNMNPETSSSDAIPTPAATVILLQDGRHGLETLLVRRRPGNDPFAGAWVFPGGAIEAVDGPVPSNPGWPLAARQAAVRELREEAGLSLAPDELVPFAHWTSPPTMPRRFLTWFFLAAAPAGSIRLNPREVDAYRWISPHKVLAAHRLQSMDLFPPTWVSLHELTAVDAVSQALRRYARRAPAVFAPRVGSLDGAMCFFYQEDAAYADLDADRPGPRHRLRVQTGRWLYERDERQWQG